MNCFKTCLRYGRKMGEAVGSIFQPLMGLTMRFSTTVDSQIAHKIPDFQYPLSTENGVPCYQKRYLLLMKYSKTFIRCNKLKVWAFLYIFLPLMGLTKIISTKVGSQNAFKMPTFKYPPSPENRISFYNERYLLRMKCFQTSLRCTRQMGGTSLCIVLPLMGRTKICSTKIDSQIAQNTRCWVIPLSPEMVCCSEGRDIHCLWSALKPS